MPFYIGVYRNPKGQTAAALENANRDAFAAWESQGVKHERYWLSEKGEMFWLCEAPSIKMVERAHRQVHGPEADEIFEVMGEKSVLLVADADEAGWNDAEA